jgi:hypothetical protein
MDLEVSAIVADCERVKDVVRGLYRRGRLGRQLPAGLPSV